MLMHKVYVTVCYCARAFGSPPREEAMTTASSFVDEMATLLAEVNARLEGIVGKPLCFTLAVVHGDDGEGAFWYTLPNAPNLLAWLIRCGTPPTTSTPKTMAQQHHHPH